MADAPINTSERAIAQNEITLAVLRESALEALIQNGKATVSESTVSSVDGGRQIKTIDRDTKQESTIIINGKAVGVRRTFDSQVKGDFSIVRVSPAAPAEKAEFELVASDWDELWSRSDKFRVSMTRTDARGNKIESYDPAVSEVVKGKFDPNGQPLRTARPAVAGEANCQRENIDNRGNKRLLREYIIHSNKLGDLSYNEVRDNNETNPSSVYYRSVVRDMKEAGKVLAIVEQRFQVDYNGDLTSVTTTARKPQKLKK